MIVLQGDHYEKRIERRTVAMAPRSEAAEAPSKKDVAEVMRERIARRAAKEFTGKSLTDRERSIDRERDTEAGT